jgi:hypothetical protein
MGIGILQGLANKYDEIQDINNITMINSKMTQMNVHSSGSGVDKNNTFHDDSSIIYDNFNLNDLKNNDNNSNDNAKNIDSYDTYNEYVRLSNLINDLKPLIIRLEDHLMTKHQDGEDSDGNNNSNNQNKTSSEADINASVDSSSSIRGSDSSSGDDLLTHSEQSIDIGIYDDDDDNNNSNTDENESLPISLHILKSIREKLVLHESSQVQQQHQHQQQQQKSVYQHNHIHDNDDQSHHLSPSYLSSRHKKQQQLTTKTTTTSTTTTLTIIPLLPTPQLEQLISLFDTNILSEVIRNAWKRTIGVYLMTYISDSIVWPPLQLINFSFVPVRYQFLYVNTCNLFWNAFLSYVANKKNN